MNTTTTDFIFEHAPASWHIFFILAAAGIVAYVAWKKYGVAAPGFAGLIGRLCRVAALVGLVIFIAGPAWRTTTTTVVPGRVLIAVDRSASMGRTDGPQSQSRLVMASQLANELAKRSPDKPLLLDYRSVGGVVGNLDADELRKNAPTALGSSSALGDELAHLVNDVRPDGLIIVSDGRVTQGSGLSALPALWRGRDLSLSVLAVGSETVEPELVIDDVQMNRAIALGEREPLVVRLSSRALSGDASAAIKVSAFIDGDQPITTTVAPPTGDAAKMLASEARLEANFVREGTAKVRVVAEYQQQQKKLQAEFNLTVNVSERKLRILVLEHRPRYEMRYLREAFKRDKTITIHTYLAEGRWRRWGEGSDSDVGPAHLPLSPSELRDYDVIIIGDIGPDSLRDSDLTTIDNVVRQNAVGLVWLPGETGAIAGFVNTKIGPLIPVEIPDAAAISRNYMQGVARKANRTAAAEVHGLLDAGEVSWSRLPSLLGAAPVLSTKPTAEVLITDQQEMPLVISRNYGAGRALFIGVDDTWRWRRNVGDLYLHRFHSQLLRFVAGGRRFGNHAWRLFANPRRAVSGEALHLNLSPLGGAPEQRPDSVTVRLSTKGGYEQLLRLSPEAQGFSLRVPAPAPGTYTLDIAAGVDARTVDSDQLIVLPPSDELRDPRIDKPALTTLVAGLGGQYHSDPAQLAAELPDLSRAESISSVRGWWDTWYALIILLSLFAIDWAIRRVNRLP
jgi:uncharacterized membrane protein